jgi:hypothetical protein
MADSVRAGWVTVAYEARATPPADTRPCHNERSDTGYQGGGSGEIAALRRSYALGFAWRIAGGGL